MLDHGLADKKMAAAIISIMPHRKPAFLKLENTVFSFAMPTLSSRVIDSSLSIQLSCIMRLPFSQGRTPGLPALSQTRASAQAPQ
jgi:hypothetical protein